MQKKNSRLFLNLAIGFLLLIGALLLESSYSNHSEMRVTHAAQKLAHLDSITDFSSNRNYPIPEIEHIGPGLYARLRKLQRFGLKNITYQLIETRTDVIERFGDGDLYEVTNHYKNNQTQRYFLFSRSENEPLRIIGY